MTLKERTEALVCLGNQLDNLPEEDMERLRIVARSKNGWFKDGSVERAVKGIAKLLDAKALTAFIARYKIPQSQDKQKTVGIVMAGNLPFVGFHDLLMALLSGHKAKIKLSSQDEMFPAAILQILFNIEPRFKNIVSVETVLKEIDAIIATGSDNTARYFEHYFAKYANIIRKNRVSVAVLDDTFEEADFKALADDILAYYGLGCRNVAKVFLPAGFTPVRLAAGLEPYIAAPMNNHKYSNNFDYQRSVLLVNQTPHYDNGGILMRETEELVSPIAVLFYEYYENLAELEQKLLPLAEKIQCVVSNSPVAGFKHLPLGTAQSPEINDFADGVDTMAFLLGI